MQAISRSTRWTTRDVVDHALGRVEQELVAYFAAEGALEPPSNFGAMQAALEAQRGTSVAVCCSARTSCECSDATWRVHMVSRTGQKGLAARCSATELDERLLKLCDDEHPVRRSLAAVGPHVTELLEVGCSVPVLGLEAFGQRAALAPFSRAARAAWLASSTSRSFGEWAVRLSHRVRKSHGDRVATDRALASEIAREALSLWRDALAEYAHARARWGDLVRERQRRARAEAAERVRQLEEQQAQAEGA